MNLLTPSSLPPISPLVHDLMAINLDNDDAESCLCRIATSEPQLSVRLIAIANSVAYRGTGATLLAAPAAIRRIGLARTRQLAIALLFGHPLNRSLPSGFTEQLWLHALAMGAAAQEIARLKRYGDTGVAYLAGLVHDLGYLIEEISAKGTVERSVETALRDNLNPEQAEERLMGANHARLTADLLSYWKAPQVVVEALASHHYDDIAPDSLAAIVFGAEKLARFIEVTDVLYAGHEHPFSPLSIDRLGIEFLFAEQLELGSDDVSALTDRIIGQVTGFSDCARALSSIH